MSKYIRVEPLQHGAWVLHIDAEEGRPKVLSSWVLKELGETLDGLKDRTDIRGLVVMAENIFGANLEELLSIQDRPEMLFKATEFGKATFAKFREMPFKTCAVIKGTVLGGGFELALGCHFRVAIDDKSTRGGLPEVGLGFLPGWGGTVGLTKMIGAEAAMKFITDPLRQHKADALWKMGIVDEIAAEDKAVWRAFELTVGGAPRRAKASGGLKRWFIDRTSVGRGMFANGAKAAIKKQTKGNLPAPPAVLKIILASLTQPEEKAKRLESQLFADLASGRVSKNLVGIFFARQESRKAPQSAKPNLNIGSIGVAGAGAMGSEIAYVSLLAGYTVILYDKYQEGLDRGWQHIHDMLMEQVKKGRMSGDTADNYLTSLAKTTDVAGFKNCDLIIEAIKEDMKLKKGLVADIDAVKQGKPYIFATNTSSLSVTEMVADAADPSMGCGLHFFNPVSKMPLVEVIAGAKTSPETIAAVQQYVLRLKDKVTVGSADSPLFIVNRVLIPYARETSLLLEQGVPPQQIEDAMKAFGMAMGPLALLDEVGLDIATKVLETANQAFGDRLAPTKAVKYINENKLLGKKGKKGIYLWDDEGKRTDFNPDVLAALKADPRPMSQLAIQERLVLIMVNEAARALEEGVVEKPWQIDLSMVFGTGFAPHHGGPLRFADSLGIANVVQKLQWLSTVAGENYVPAKLLLSMAAKGEKFYR